MTTVISTHHNLNKRTTRHRHPKRRQHLPSWRRNLFLAATSVVACQHHSCRALAYISPSSSMSTMTTSISYDDESSSSEESYANVGGTLPEIVIEIAEAEQPQHHHHPVLPSPLARGSDYFWLDRLGDESKHLVQRQYQRQQQRQQQRTRKGHRAPDPTTASTTQTPFSLLSWNILAQSLYDKSSNNQKRYNNNSNKHDHHRNEHYSWETRLDWILNTIVTADADIVCLQEVEQETFYTDLLPAMRQHGYDGAVQGGSGVKEIKRRKGKGDRAHVVATFWNTERFQPLPAVSLTNTETTAQRNHQNQKNTAEEDDEEEGCAHMARGRTLTSVLQDIRASSTTVTTANVEDNNDDQEDEAVSPVPPTLAVMNCHLEGHPQQYAARIRQLQHTMEDLAKRTNPTGVTLNGVAIAGDFNCELQSSACSTYLRIGRVGRKGGLGGVHGTSALAVPPSILESDEATEILHPIMEWGHALPNHEMETIPPHPFRRNSLQSAYPPALGRTDPTTHFTYCARPNRPVAGLDQIWYSGFSMTRVALRKLFPSSYSDMRRKDVLKTGLPAPSYPSDHLPIGAVFDWNACNTAECSVDARTKCTDAGVRELFIAQDQKPQLNKPKSPIMAYTELDFLLCVGPFDSDDQRKEIESIVEEVPDLPAQKGQKPSEEQLRKLSVTRERKKVLMMTASESARQVLQRILKLNKEVAAYEEEIGLR